jgi:prepilin-type N-terminal cleavage/methylation domain-containing protein
MEAMVHLISNRTTIVRRRIRGFSMLELVVSVAIILILSAIIAPRMMNVTYAVKLRSAAYDMSGAIQKGRIESVRRNIFISMRQTTLAAGDTDYYVDLNRNTTLDTSDPQVVVPRGVTVFFGTGSGAPGEAAFVASLGFAPDATGVLPSFNARGLPCIPNVTNTLCPALPGGGFVYFLSDSQLSGNTATAWCAIAVTPSGRVQVWTYDGAGWRQL